jgi:hypothetical protein
LIRHYGANALEDAFFTATGVAFDEEREDGVAA